MHKYRGGSEYSLHTKCVVSLKILTLSHKKLSRDWGIKFEKLLSLLSSNFAMEPTAAIFMHMDTIKMILPTTIY